MSMVIEMKKEDPKQSLQERFRTVQSKMVSLGMKLGLNHPEVIEISQELDEIHNQILKRGKENDHSQINYAPRSDGRL